MTITPNILAALTLQNADPAWLWVAVVIAAVGVLVLTYRGIFRRSGRRLTWLLLAMRVAGVLAIIVALVKPAFTTSHEKTQRPRVAVVIDDSQSMSLPHQSGDGKAPTPRYQKALNWLTTSDDGRALHQNFDVSVFNAAGEPLAEDEMPREPAAEQTDLVRSLRGVASRLRGQPVAGVVLVSDGRDTTGRQDYLTMQEYPFPVYALGFRQPTGNGKGKMFDLAVVSVDAPQRVLVHNAAAVKMLVSKDGGGPMTLPLQIERAGQTLQTERVELPDGPIQKLVTLSYTPTEPGDFVMTVRLPGDPDERTTINNTQMFKLRVDAQPIRVLYVEGFLRSEYTFLRERLGHDPDVDLISFVRSANPDQAAVTGVLVGDELINAERLKKIDVVLLGDFEARMLDDAAYKALKDWVEAGGGLMVIGGYHNLAQDGLFTTPLAEALPVEPTDGPFEQVDEPFKFKLTPEGLLHPAMFLTGDPQRDTEAWAALPELRGIAAVKTAKPGATVLARHPRANSSGGDGQGFVVLATQSYGKGSVAVFTADTTWRWSRIARLTGHADTMYVRFWSQMVRWLAKRDTQSDRPALAVSTDAAAYKRGEPVTVTIRRNPASMVPGIGAESQPPALDVSVRAPDGRVAALSPSAATSDPNMWTATYFPDRGGRFEVSAKLVASTNEGNKDVANQISEFLVHGSSLELDDPSTNPAALGQIARLTGGVYADIDDAAASRSIVASLPSKPRVTYEVKTAQVWDNPILMLFFIVVLSVEWFVRRRNQLV